MLTVLCISLLVLLAILLLAGLKPVSSPWLSLEPDPAHTYTQVLERFQQIQQSEQATVAEVSRSRLLEHGQRTRRAYVLAHGLTNSTLQWLEFGQALHARGHNVLIPRMPYHGLNSHRCRELAPITPQDLQVYANAAVDLAAGLGDEVIAIGTSGGGTIAAWMVQNRPEVRCALLVAPFFGIYGLPGWLNAWLANVFSRLPNIVVSTPWDPWRAWAYQGQATRGIAAFFTLGQEVQRAAGVGQKPYGPVNVVTSARDTVANHRLTAGLVESWQRAGAEVVDFKFATALNIPHNVVDADSDPAKVRIVYAKVLELLGEDA